MEKRAGFLVLFVLVSHADFVVVDEAANLSSCTARNPDREIGNGKSLQWTVLYGNGSWLMAMVVPIASVQRRKNPLVCSILDNPDYSINSVLRYFSFYIRTCCVT